MELLRLLIDTSDVRVGIVTRNITLEPAETIRQLLDLHGIDFTALGFVGCIPLREDKLQQFRMLRKQFGINPALGFACGDEHRDYAAAFGVELHPFLASYGFEDFWRLRDNAVPEEVIATAPKELAERLCHALGVLAPLVISCQPVGR